MKDMSEAFRKMYESDIEEAMKEGIRKGIRKGSEEKAEENARCMILDWLPSHFKGRKVLRAIAR